MRRRAGSNRAFASPRPNPSAKNQGDLPLFNLKKLTEILSASLLREPSSAAPLPALEINRIATSRQRPRTESQLSNRLPASF